jgi:GH24 family phage-related lysozyme (muramidase)
MNWYKRAKLQDIQKVSFNWSNLLKGMSIPVTVGLLALLSRSNVTPQEISQIAKNNPNNPSAIQEYVQQKASTQPATQPIPKQQIAPTSQPVAKIEPKPQPKPQKTKFDYNDFTQSLTGNEGKKSKLYDDGTGVFTVGIGHAVGKDPSDPRAKKSRKIFEQLFGNASKWDSLWQGGSLTNQEINILAKHDIDEHQSRAKEMFPKYDTYPYYLQKALLDGVYRGDIGEKTQQLINAGNWSAAAKEYTNRRDYRDAEQNGMGGIKTRMDENKSAFLQYAQELGQQ